MRVNEVRYYAWNEFFASLGGTLSLIGILLGILFSHYIYNKMIADLVKRIYATPVTGTKEGVKQQVKKVMEILSLEGQVRLYYKVQKIS